MAAFVYFGNLTQTFDVPPMLLNSEIEIYLPCSEAEWTAATADAWYNVRRTRPMATVTFSDVLKSLLSPSAPTMLSCSTFGQYIMLHALVQQIWYVRQDSALHSTYPRLDFIELALQKWQAGWEINPESSPSPQNPYSALTLISHVLLRYSQLRLQVDMRRMRKALLSHDVDVISQSLGNSLEPASFSTDLTKTAYIAIDSLRDQVILGIASSHSSPLSLSGLQCHSLAFECCESTVLL